MQRKGVAVRLVRLFDALGAPKVVFHCGSIVFSTSGPEAILGPKRGDGEFVRRFGGVSGIQEGAQNGPLANQNRRTEPPSVVCFSSWPPVQSYETL